MKKILVLIFLGYAISLIFHFRPQIRHREVISPLASSQKGLGPLSKYSLENLGKREYQESQIKLGRIVKSEQNYTSYIFYYDSQGKKVSGLANLPKGDGPFPLMVMIRGYVDDKIYQTGMGTQKPGEFFAKNGFITFAPDFLGFGQSDDSDADILEDRFVRPVTVLDLLASIKTLKQADAGKVAIWAHSNGGQIALSVLEINRQSIPTVLWAPVTKGFPESVTTYMSQLDDLGLKVKTRIDDFLKDYQPEKFSITPYFADIKAPLQVHQGTGDEYIESIWTDEFVNKMKSLGKFITYYTYKDDDHDLRKNWDTVISRDLEFFREQLSTRFSTRSGAILSR